MKTNKRWHKKICTCVWWFISLIPLMVFVVNLIAFALANNQTGSIIDISTIINNISYLNNFIGISYVYDMFESLFEILSIDNTLILIICSWLVSTQLIRLVVNVICAIFNLFNEFIERSMSV